ncbi:MAG: hypothetical protein RL094_460 [Candidatus Parcubacteria bacterium]|jgi:8-oxo-dGTP pyrophosphatase MutT (NUDIX family)
MRFKSFNSLRAIIYKLGYPIAKSVWFFTRPTTQGVKCLIIKKGEPATSGSDQLLLIRHTYGKGTWNLPGGGIKRDEDHVEAIKREVFEELGICLEDTKIRAVGSFFTTREFKKDTVFCFAAEVTNEYFKIDEHEIAEAKWFSLDTIPDHTSTIVGKIRKLSSV